MEGMDSLKGKFQAILVNVDEKSGKMQTEL